MISLRSSPVNVTKSSISCGNPEVYWRNPQWKTSFFVQWEDKSAEQKAKPDKLFYVRIKPVWQILLADILF